MRNALLPLDTTSCFSPFVLPDGTSGENCKTYGNLTFFCRTYGHRKTYGDYGQNLGSVNLQHNSNKLKRTLTLTLTQSASTKMCIGCVTCHTFSARFLSQCAHLAVLLSFRKNYARRFATSMIPPRELSYLVFVARPVCLSLVSLF